MSFACRLCARQARVALGVGTSKTVVALPAARPLRRMYSTQTELEATLNVLPKFTTKASNVKVLSEPAEFYSWLLVRLVYPTLLCLELLFLVLHDALSSFFFFFFSLSTPSLCDLVGPDIQGQKEAVLLFSLPGQGGASHCRCLTPGLSQQSRAHFSLHRRLPSFYPRGSRALLSFPSCAVESSFP